MIRGAEGRNRTIDTRIFSPLLYRLSYLGYTGTHHNGGRRPLSTKFGKRVWAFTCAGPKTVTTTPFRKGGKQYPALGLSLRGASATWQSPNVGDCFASLAMTMDGDSSVVSFRAMTSEHSPSFFFGQKNAPNE